MTNLPMTGSAGTVEVHRRHQGRVAGQQEIAIYSREHGQQVRIGDAQRYAHGHHGAGGGCLTESECAHQE